jgi:hypothetical protein
MHKNITFMLMSLIASCLMWSCVSESPRRAAGQTGQGALEKASDSGAKQGPGSPSSAASGPSWDGSTLEGTAIFKVIPVE